MVQISKRLETVRLDYDRARELAMKGQYDLSDESFMEAYSNAIDLFETYDHAMFLDDELKLLKNIIDEFEIL